MLFLHSPSNPEAAETPSSKSVPTGISKFNVTKLAPSFKAYIVSAKVFPLLSLNSNS